ASGAFNTQAVTLSVNNLPPSISGDLAVPLLIGASVVLTTADLSATDPGGGTVTFSVTGTTRGYVALSNAPTTPVSNFTAAQVASGSVLFVSDGSAGSTASFTVIASDGNA